MDENERLVLLYMCIGLVGLAFSLWDYYKKDEKKRLQDEADTRERLAENEQFTQALIRMHLLNRNVQFFTHKLRAHSDCFYILSTHWTAESITFANITLDRNQIRARKNGKKWNIFEIYSHDNDYFESPMLGLSEEEESSPKLWLPEEEESSPKLYPCYTTRYDDIKYQENIMNSMCPICGVPTKFYYDIDKTECTINISSNGLWINGAEIVNSWDYVQGDRCSGVIIFIEGISCYAIQKLNENVYNFMMVGILLFSYKELSEATTTPLTIDNVNFRRKLTADISGNIINN